MILESLILGGIVGRGVGNMVSYDKNNAKAQSINLKALNTISESQRLLAKQQEKTKNSLIKLANRKKGILQTSMKQFIELYETIIRINFKEGEGIKELNLSQMTLSEIKEVEIMSLTASKALSTEQTIATMVIRGGISGVIAKEAEMDVSMAKMRNSQARVMESQVETICTELDDVYQRSERLTTILTQMNILLLRSISNTSDIIKKNGSERSKYSQYERDCLQACINTTVALKKIIDTPLLDSEGEIAIQSMEAIKIGEEYLDMINNEVNR